MATHALERHQGPVHDRLGERCVQGRQNYNSGLLCQGFTYGDYPLHIPNNMDYTVTPDNGELVTAFNNGPGCTLSLGRMHPQIAAYRRSPAHAARCGSGLPNDAEATTTD